MMEDKERRECMRELRYRLEAVEAFIVAIELKSRLGGPKALEIFIDGKLRIEGNSNAYINPVLEVGLIHCRALLEFLGLCEKNGKLRSIKDRRTDDRGIESLGLPRITAKQITDDHSRRALLALFRTANKGLAHVTASFARSEGTLLIKAGHQVLALFESYPKLKLRSKTE